MRVIETPNACGGNRQLRQFSSELELGCCLVGSGGLNLQSIRICSSQLSIDELGVQAIQSLVLHQRKTEMKKTWLNVTYESEGLKRFQQSENLSS